MIIATLALPTDEQARIGTFTLAGNGRAGRCAAIKKLLLVIVDGIVVVLDAGQRVGGA